MTYKTRFENIREQYGISREKFAESIGVDALTVLKWENGIEKPDLMYLVFICKEFDISLNQLLRDEPVHERKLINLMKPSDDQSEVMSCGIQGGKYPGSAKHISAQVHSSNLPCKPSPVKTYTIIKKGKLCVTSSLKKKLFQECLIALVLLIVIFLMIITSDLINMKINMKNAADTPADNKIEYEQTHYYDTQYLTDEDTHTYYFFIGDVNDCDYIEKQINEEESDKYIKLYDDKNAESFYCKKKYTKQCYTLAFMFSTNDESDPGGMVIFVVPKSLAKDRNELSEVNKEDYINLFQYGGFEVYWIPKYIIPDSFVIS